ncbi:MAG: hypothetical protein WCD89_07655 [Anaerocolumna sp.]
MNLCGIKFKENTVVKYDEKRKQEGKLFGVPVLYPTPNRVDGNTFTFQDKTFNGQMHGFAKHVAFEITKKEISEAEVILKGTLLWDEKRDGFLEFPFKSRLIIELSIHEREILYRYTIVNESSGVLPFGFGLHPFFHSEKGQETIRVFSDYVMEMTNEKLPTGKLLPVKETAFDLKKGKKVSEQEYDHVYTVSENPAAVIAYKNFELILEASEEFGHIVVYTPQENFFCIENQTCSTNAHNLYAKGFEKESGLLFIEPGDKKSGFIRYRFQESAQV